jgi:hypothetical protein
MSANELDEVLSLGESLHSDLTTIITVNVRHSSAPRITQGYLEAASEHDNFGLCFVAGNSAYLTGAERQLDPKSRIKQSVATSRTRLHSAPIFIGAEGLPALTNELATEFSTIPFALMSNNTEERVAKLGAEEIDAGIYSPCDLSNQSDQGLVKSLGHYAMRRKWVRKKVNESGFSTTTVMSQISNGEQIEVDLLRVLTEAIYRLALCDVQRIGERLRAMSRMGVSYLALLPAQESYQSNEQLARILDELPA